MALNQAVIDKAKEDYTRAKIAGDKKAMEAAHARAEAERAKAGYSGGADGSAHITITSGGSSGKSSGSSRKSATVYSPEGTASTGYIENGQTYLNDGTRIGDGYSVHAANGKYYTMVDGKGQETSEADILNKMMDSRDKQAQQASAKKTQDAISQMEEEYNDRLAEQQRLQEAAINASVQQGVNALNKQKSTLGETYDQAAREAYIAHMQAQKGLNEQYAAAGITGGPTESGRIALENTYSNNVADISKQRASSLADIDAAITDAQLTGDIQKAQNAAQIAQTAAERYLELAQNRIALEREVVKEAESEEERKLQYYLTYIDAYADNPQAEIDKLLNEGVSQTDPRILALKALMNQQKSQAEEAAREEELARIKASSKGSGVSNGYDAPTGITQSAGSTSGTTSSSGWNPLSKLEDKATVKTFMNLHQGSYNKADIETDYKNGFLTDEAYKLLKQSLTDANAKAAVNTYWKEGFNQ